MSDGVERGRECEAAVRTGLGMRKYEKGDRGRDQAGVGLARTLNL